MCSVQTRSSRPGIHNIHICLACFERPDNNYIIQEVQAPDIRKRTGHSGGGECLREPYPEVNESTAVPRDARHENPTRV